MAAPLIACGVVPLGGLLQLALVEQRRGEHAGALDALTFEPGEASAVRRELASLAPVAVVCGYRLPPPESVSTGDPQAAEGAAANTGERTCDRLLAEAGVRPNAWCAEGAQAVADLPRIESCVSAGGTLAARPPAGVVAESVVDGIFGRLLGVRPPARRHPFGVRARIEALGRAAVRLRGGSPWDRRIEEIEALACALCAFELAAGNCLLVGERAEGMVVLPGREPLRRFETRGAVPLVERLALP